MNLRVEHVTNERSEKLLVRADYITRCAWCGTPYSLNWVATESGRIYCSIECQSAEQSGSGRWVGLCSIALGLILIIWVSVFSFFNPSIFSSSLFEGMFYGVVFLLLGFCTFSIATEGSNYKDRKDKYRNTQLLICEYCNHIPAPGVTVCDNCGASLADADFSSDSWPEWFVLPKKIGPCTNCGKSFVYPVLSADGNNRCPRCGKPV